MGLAERLFTWRAQAAVRRAARERRRNLEREMAAYDTAAQRSDFMALLDRHPDDATAELREVLADRQLARRNRRWPATGGAWSRQ